MRGKADLPPVVILRWLEADLLLIFPHGKTKGFCGFCSRSGVTLEDMRGRRYNACTFNRCAVYVSRTVKYTANRKTLKTP
jgi:hypothetical protein